MTSVPDYGSDDCPEFPGNLMVTTSPLDKVHFIKKIHVVKSTFLYNLGKL